MKDLTKGKPSTLILAFALPIFFANLLQLTYSLVDTRIVGTFLGEDALAAVGATTTLSNLIIGFLQGLSGGFAIIIAQKFGAKDYKNVKDIKVRENYGIFAGIVGIICNLILFACKFFAGIITGSVSISADAFNNLSDAGSSIVTLAGFKMAGKPADTDHPFGHGRIEYIA